MRLLLSSALALGWLAPLPAHADGPPRRVAIEYQNLTTGQGLSTSAFVAHKPGLHLYVVGKPADLSLRMLAEEGNAEWILGTAVADQGHDFGDAAVSLPALPGQTRRVEITVTPEHPEVSGVVMLGQTNDGFAGIDAVSAYGLDHAATIDIYALDAGTATNNEDKANLRVLGGLGREPEQDVVRAHPGLKPGGEIPAEWRFDPAKPVARVTITPMATPNG